MTIETYVKHDLTVDPVPLLASLSKEKQQIYSDFCQRYSFSLDAFQVYCIYGLLRGENVLATVPTSCGKTLIAEFAIFESLGKESQIKDLVDENFNPVGDQEKRLSRVIYTSPIKTLSNQKYSEFSKKFGESNVGIITGDIKFNPDASLLIMTTEILRDLVLKGDTILQTVITVIFDEVHYINNEDRGYVWEESIMLLPESVKLVMLSATMGNPEEFAKWISNIKGRTCHLTVHGVRPVKLNHQLYMIHNTGEESKFRSYFPDSKFDRELYRSFLKEWENPNAKLVGAKKTDKLCGKVGEKQALNRLVKQLEIEDRCPALFFVFSRHRCEMYAKMLEICFHDSAKQSEVERVINYYLAKYQYKFETLKLSVQITEITRLAKLGIGYHHASLLPFAKEIIEHLFQRQLIKVMFVTETFSVGINMPTRTVVFTELSKNVGGTWRPLWTDEFYQMAGRAGRRGLDTEGHVVYAPISRILPVDDLEKMITGRPFAFQGKFRFDYVNLLQHLSCHQRFEIVERAFLYQGLNDRVQRTKELEREQSKRLIEVERKIEAILISPDARELLLEYKALSQQIETNNRPQFIGNLLLSIDQKERRRLAKQMEDLRTRMKSADLFGQKSLKSEYSNWLKLSQEKCDLVAEIEKCQEFLDSPESILKSEYHRKLEDLRAMGYLKREQSDYKLTIKGILASRVQTVDGLLISQLLEEGAFNEFDAENLALALVSIASDLPKSNDIDNCEFVKENWLLNYFWNRCHQLGDELVEKFIGYEPTEPCSALLASTLLWYRGGGFHETVAPISEFQGNFVRTMLRLIHLCEEMVKCFSDLDQFLELEVKLREIMEKVNRDIIVFDSLYIKHN